MQNENLSKIKEQMATNSANIPSYIESLGLTRQVTPLTFHDLFYSEKANGIFVNLVEEVSEGYETERELLEGLKAGDKIMKGYYKGRKFLLFGCVLGKILVIESGEYEIKRSLLNPRKRNVIVKETWGLDWYGVGQCSRLIEALPIDDANALLALTRLNEFSEKANEKDRDLTDTFLMNVYGVCPANAKGYDANEDRPFKDQVSDIVNACFAKRFKSVPHCA